MSTNAKPHNEPLRFAQHAYKEFFIDIPAGITFQDLLRPEYWRLNADGRLRPNDIVRCHSETEGFDVPLNVVAILPNAGVIMEVKGAKSRPGTPMGDKLIAAEAAARAEVQAERQAAIDAAVAGGRP